MIKDVDAKMWHLFKNGVQPKEFFEKPEVKNTMKSTIERHEEEALLEKASKLADKYLAEVQQKRKDEARIKQQSILKSHSEKNLEMIKKKDNLQLSLILRKPARQVSNDWQQ